MPVPVSLTGALASMEVRVEVTALREAPMARPDRERSVRAAPVVRIAPRASVRRTSSGFSRSPADIAVRLVARLTACPGDAVCVAQANVCAAPCTDNSDCRMAEGYMCTPVPGAGSICIPPVQIPDGGITFPDGGFGLPDGGITLPEGGIGFPDGGIIFPDGGFGLPDGSFPGL